MSNATANEQVMLELVNRARLDPLGEAARFGITINQGLAAGTISGSPMQPLAMNNLLIDSARTHSQWMINTDTFSHTGAGGSNPGNRMTAAGYSFTGSWTWGENIARRGTTGTPNLTNFIIQEHQDLFLSPGHRVNILNPNFREIGVGQIGGVFTQNGTNWNDSMVTQNFAKTATNFFFLGVAYNDTNNDKFYTAGEGRGGVTISVQPVAGGASVSSMGGSAGGFERSAAAGNYNVTFSGGGLAGAMTVQAALSQNVKLDVVNGDTIWGSDSFTLVSGVTKAALYGVTNINLTGGAAADTLTGNAGANVLTGNGGDDVFFGGGGNDTANGGEGNDIASGYGLRSAYTITQQGNSWIVSGGNTGADTLNGVEAIQFSDQLFTLGGSNPAAPPALPPSGPSVPPVPPANPAPNTPNTPNALEARADFNGDGNGDLLWQKGTALALWTMDGAQADAKLAISNTQATAWKAITTGDFNADGQADIVWQNKSGAIEVWLMNGSALQSKAAINQNPGKAWHVKPSGDFDGDGQSDLLLQNDNGSVAVWLLNGTSVKSTNLVGGNPGKAWQVRDTGDFNGDGKSDLLLQNTNGQAAVWLLDGSKVLSDLHAGGNPGSSWKVKGAGDFDGDGKADILWQHNNGTVSAWLMNGTSVVSSANVGTNPGLLWKVRGAEDVNGDGKDDILIQKNNGAAVVWLTNGTNLPGSTTIGNPGSGWNIVGTSS